ncbi:transposase [Nakamurella alba]|uniref:transposase n=1 Tax=Nakamurella alba TaxID=2665158 RepID=UPI0038993A87
MPRDRDGSFEPAIARKRQRRLTGVDQIVLSLTARGPTTGEIAAHFAEIFPRKREVPPGAQVSKETISKITDKVLEDMSDWRDRPLDKVYPVVFIVPRKRGGAPIDHGQGPRRAGHEPAGLRRDRRVVHRGRDILGLWVGRWRR